MTDDVRFEMSEERRLACIDVKGHYEEVLSPGFARLMAWAAPKGIVRGPPLGIYLDSPQDTPREECRSKLGVPVSEDAREEGEVHIETVGPREEAVLLHKGPYEETAASYGKVFDTIFRTGYRVAGAPMEVYLTDPQAAPSEELLTEIRVPVKRA
jgi:AraC family transcriptional regulator